MSQQDFNFWSLCLGVFSALVSLAVAIVVFWYTLETQKLRKASEEQVKELKRAAEEQERRRPILRADTTRRASPVHATFVQDGNELQRTGLGCYLTLTLVNVGKTTSFKCQPVLTMVYRKATTSGDYETPEEWIPLSSWIPLPLRWSLDELNVKAQGIPTADRDLVPQRPYLFDLGGASSLNPDVFELSVTVFPFSQPTSFLPGAERCFEITVFSDNAQPLKKWVRVRWQGGFSIADEKIDADVLRNPPPDLISKLNFEELASSPCSVAEV